MLWIGITGPMGSGKSTVAKILRERGYDVIDADQVVGQVLGPGGAAERQIIAAFGPAVARAEGGLDRRRLAAEVFGKPDKLKQLEAIIHPRVRDRVAEARTELRDAGRTVAFYDVPLLFEKNMAAQFDHVLVTSSAPPIRLARAMARTGLTAAEIEARWANQMSAEEKEARATAVIRNDGDEVDLARAVDQALARLGVPPPPVPNRIR